MNSLVDYLSEIHEAAERLERFQGQGVIDFVGSYSYDDMHYSQLTFKASMILTPNTFGHTALLSPRKVHAEVALELDWDLVTSDFFEIETVGSEVIVTNADDEKIVRTKKLSEVEAIANAIKGYNFKPRIACPRRILSLGLPPVQPRFFRD